MKGWLKYLLQRRHLATMYLRVWLSVAKVRILLSSRGYSSFEQSPVKVKSVRSDINPAYIAGVVRRVSKLVPGALCLAQAVSTQRLLARYGFETIIRIGVKSNPFGRLEAHAWVVFDDKIILGGSASQLESYQVMADMTSATF